LLKKRKGENGLGKKNSVKKEIKAIPEEGSTSYLSKVRYSMLK